MTIEKPTMRRRETQKTMLVYQVVSIRLQIGNGASGQGQEDANCKRQKSSFHNLSEQSRDKAIKQQYSNFHAPQSRANNFNFLRNREQRVGNNSDFPQRPHT